VKFGELPPLRRALVVMNALAILPGAYAGLIIATYLQTSPHHALWHAAPAFVLPLSFAFLTWASLRSRAKWFQTAFAILMLPLIPFGTIYGVISLRVNWGK
jgi:hypothetical protein